MNCLLKGLAVIFFGFSALTTFASPSYLITHNKTNVESNAYVDGSIPSPNPTKANSTNSVLWVVVRMACFGHSTDNKCPALIKMATNTDNPVNLGTVLLDVETGEITPKTLSGNGYTLTANGPGEATLTKN